MLTVQELIFSIVKYDLSLQQLNVKWAKTHLFSLVYVVFVLVTRCLYMKPIWCNSIPNIYARLKGCQSAMGICACCSIWNLCGVMVFQRSMLNCRGCQSAMGICACCSIWNLCGVMVFQTSMFDWRGVHLPWVYLHAALYETYLVKWYSRDLCSIGGGMRSICHESDAV